MNWLTWIVILSWPPSCPLHHFPSVAVAAAAAADSPGQSYTGQNVNWAADATGHPSGSWPTLWYRTHSPPSVPSTSNRSPWSSSQPKCLPESTQRRTVKLKSIIPPPTAIKRTSNVPKSQESLNYPLIPLKNQLINTLDIPHINYCMKCYP